MMKFNYVAILLMITITCLMTVYSIKCYQCRSDLHKGCDLADEKYLKECTGTSRNFGYNFTALKRVGNQYYKADVLCRSIYQTLLSGDRTKDTVIRECGTIHGGVKAYYFNSKEIRKVTYDCARDGCNKGTSKYRKPRTILILYIFLELILWIFIN